MDDELQQPLIEDLLNLDDLPELAPTEVPPSRRQTTASTTTSYTDAVNYRRISLAFQTRKQAVSVAMQKIKLTESGKGHAILVSNLDDTTPTKPTLVQSRSERSELTSSRKPEVSFAPTVTVVTPPTSQEIVPATTTLPTARSGKPERTAFEIDTSQPDFHCLSTEELVKRFNTDTQQGLSAKEASYRLARDGPNTIIPPSPNLLVKVIKDIFGGFNIVLWISAILCIISWRPLGNPPDPVNLALAIILMVIAIGSTLYGWWQEFQAGSVMKSIGKLLPQDVALYRDGSLHQGKVSELVVGDIVQLKGGNRVPADCRLVAVSGLKIDQAILTGENEPVSSTAKAYDKYDNYFESKNIAFMGTNIIEGSATGVVVATGNDTVMGSITISTGTTEVTKSYLDMEIRRLIIAIAIVSAITTVSIIIAWSVWLRVKYPKFQTPSDLIINIIGVLVSYLPEGLPVCIALALTLAGKRMFTQGVLVKRTHALETLGSVNIIASDKTGTLTENRMTVVHIFSDNKLHSTNDLTKNDFIKDKTDIAVQKLFSCMYLCSGAKYVDSAGEGSASKTGKKILGDASDTAFIRFAEQYVDVEKERKKHKKLFEIPFNSKNKWMLSIHQNSDDPNDTASVMLLMKGASEIMIKRSTKIIQRDGTIVDFDKTMREKTLKKVEEIANNGERVLGLCMNTVQANDKTFPIFSPKFSADDYDIPTDGLTFLGLVCLIDPPRAEVPRTISSLKKAGIRVMMVTGDHPGTAVAIARQCGIVTSREVQDASYLKKERSANEKVSLAIIGSSIPSFDAEDWKRILANDEIVFARTSPEHKLTIVRACQDNGHVVAVTGDGVNDAPALKQADCGLAMGAGSDVAQDAADFVIVSNNFSSILTGIENGRLLFDNLTKALLYLFPTGSFSQVWPVLANVFLGVPLALSSYFMVYVCCIIDVWPSLSLVYEKGESDLMRRKPRKPGIHLVNIWIALHAFGFLGLIQTMCGFVMYFWYFQTYCDMSARDLVFIFDAYTEGYKNFTQVELNDCKSYGQSSFFVGLVVIQMFNALSSRTQKKSFFQQNPAFGAGQNLYLFLGLCVSLIFAIFTLYVPFMNTTFGTRPVPGEIWGGAIGFGLLIFTLDEARKFFRRNYKVQKRRKIISPNSGIAMADLQASGSDDDDDDDDDNVNVTDDASYVTVEEK